MKARRAACANALVEVSLTQVNICICLCVHIDSKVCIYIHGCMYALCISESGMVNQTPHVSCGVLD